ncbi:MAG TPA: hypothetical protein VFR26_11465 [Acidimicrobiales bacterium]|jgi:hypothetical protein|nr:hypothetical protein [Acidimicrobiales bacterium]
MGKASSSKKVARAARAGGRSAGNKQRNLLFPGVIGAIMVLGVALVAFAANDRKSETDVPPVLGDHWHAAVGFYICDQFEPDIAEFESRVGIHTHGDGVIHIHPSSAAGAGENATLGTFLEGAGVTLTDTELTMGDKSWKEGDQKCGDEDGELVVAQWKDVQSSDEKPALIRRDFDSIRFREDGEGYTIAFVPEGTTDIPKPASAAQLQALGAADDPTATTSTSAGATDTTAPGATTTVPTTAPATTAPAG